MTGLSSISFAADDPAILVTLGDSYSSGEGNPDFYGWSNRVISENEMNSDWLAHRSENAWAGMITLSGVDGPMKNHKDTNWFFAAASGAEIRHLTGEQSKTYNFDIGNTNYSNTQSLPPQFSIFDGLTLTSNDFVTVSIGGNDIGFSDLIGKAVTSKEEEEFNSFIGEKKTLYESTLKAQLRAAYLAIAAKAGDATVIVVGYPYLVNPDGFTVSVYGVDLEVTANEATALENAVDWFNDELSDLVDDVRNNDNKKIYFADVRSAFSESGQAGGHEAYTETPYIHPLNFAIESQDIDKSAGIPYDLGPFGSITIPLGSSCIHPNAAGQAKYAEAVQSVINSLTPADSTVNIVWSDDNDQDGIRPESVTVTFADDSTVTLSEENSWTATKSYIPMNVASPSWSLTSPAGYTSSPSTSGADSTFTLTHAAAEVNKSAQIIWNDNDNSDNIRPDSVSVNLITDDDNVIDTGILSAENSWAYEWTKLDKYASGTEISYSLDLDDNTPEGYTLSKSESDGVVTFTLTHAPLPVSRNEFFVCGTDIVAAENLTVAGESGTAVLSFDTDDNPVLTLTNFTGSYDNSGANDISAAIDYCADGTKPLTIVLVGENSVTATESGDGGSTFGIYTSNSVTFTGSGSLTATGAGIGIFARGQGSKIIIDADVTAICSGEESDVPCGTASALLTVTSDGALTANGLYIGIETDELTVEDGGTVVATKTSDFPQATAIMSFDTLTLALNNNRIYAGESEATASEISADALTANKYSYVNIRSAIKYSVTVIGGSADKTTAEAGETVKITADVPDGKKFWQWTVTGAEIADNKTNPATFVMPANDVSAVASFVEDSDDPEPKPDGRDISKPDYVPSGNKPSETTPSTDSGKTDTPVNNEDTTDPEDVKIPEDTTSPAGSGISLPGIDNNADWNEVLGLIDELPEGDTLLVVMNDTTVFPGDVLDAIAGKDIDLVLDMGSGAAWKLNGKDVTGTAGDIDLGVSFGTSGIPADVINNVTGERYSVTLHINHNGPFGFTATLSVALRPTDAGLFANLFLYDPAKNALDFVSSARIRGDGTADLPFDHASDYTIIIDDHPLDGSIDAESDTNPHTGAALGGLAALIIAGAAVFVSKKRNR